MTGESYILSDNRIFNFGKLQLTKDKCTINVPYINYRDFAMQQTKN